MSKRTDRLLIEDRYKAAERTLRYTAGFDEQLFLEQEQTIDSVVRNIQILGEAATRLSKEFKEAHPEIEWQAITGMRHRLVHDYFEVEERLIWRVVETKLPDLYQWLKKILGSDMDGSTKRI